VRGAWLRASIRPQTSAAVRISSSPGETGGAPKCSRSCWRRLRRSPFATTMGPNQGRSSVWTDASQIAFAFVYLVWPKIGWHLYGTSHFPASLHR
jgi:hypothetical protein